jgi:hypothetical protein
MKLAAIRSQTDIDDAALLLGLLRATGHDCETTWTLVGGRVDGPPGFSKRSATAVVGGVDDQGAGPSFLAPAC